VRKRVAWRFAQECGLRQRLVSPARALPDRVLART
jgi:hypothetical protein